MATPPETSPSSPTETAVPPEPGSPTSAGPSTAVPQTMPRWLWVAYPVALIGLGTVWGAVLSILLGRQVAGIVTDPRLSAGALGIVVSVASVVSIFAQPVMGRISDMTRTRFLGRRNLWVLIGAVAGAAGLLVTAYASDIVGLTISWAVAIIPVAMVQAALTAVLPERVPLARRGTMSALVGVSTVLGGVIGAVLASSAGSIATSYTIVAAFLVITCALFAFTTKDADWPVERPSIEQRRASRRLPGLRAYPDFWLTFLGRFALMLGNFVFTGFSLFMLRDYIKVGDGTIEAATRAVATSVGIGSVSILVFALVGGLLVDKFGKIRIFVGLASLLFVPAGIILLVSPTFTSFLISSAIIGAAFGTFLSVDQVLISRVIPDGPNAARDLGVLNVATAGPQVIAPALAGGIIAATGAYPILFAMMIVLVILAAISVRFVRSVP